VGLGWMLSWNLLGRVWDDAVIFGDDGIGCRSVGADNTCQKVFKKDSVSWPFLLIPFQLLCTVRKLDT
jgi:hypothetical protein